MKSLLHALVGAVSLRVSLSAVAGPNWDVIESARTAKRAEAQQHKPQKPDDSKAMLRHHDAMMQKCREMMDQAK
ncbi:hypothetical protein CURE108131_18980 [Cupriavidus respiraculi]|uniref:Uncharacterized protein n=1 Tax=Cupriavidus respiraculi TaxID=195930 RepID=A0ABM8XTX2_9BURK|nr:hypothetical protein [Cupriavidus respiraculi]MBY4949461.1 hypothetical protein [Cupriavidus respiraculi]CAG9183774.1 hypothetical protein LMG21510_04932 [Cupriavidus respiraculi]